MAWKQARRARLIEMLGGECVRCGDTVDLEFDHIDPCTKIFAVCAGLSKAWDVLVEEASPQECHAASQATERHTSYKRVWRPSKQRVFGG
jgi:5-methylcytosine-specific restriction endonuclease McrA